MHDKRWVVALIGGIAALALAAACGGGEEAAPPPTAAPPPVPAGAPQIAPTATPRPLVTVAPTPPPSPAARPQPTATPAPPPSAAPSGRLRVALSSFDNEAVRPSLGRYGTTGSFLGAMYDWLVWNDAEGSLVSGVLRQWEMASDARSWTLTVREGMRFQNGDPLTAEDVKFSMERIIEDFPDPLHTGFASLWVEKVASVEVVSPSIARLSVKQPWPTLPFDTSVRTGSEGAVVPRAYMQRVGVKEFDQRPIGSGPWMMTLHEVGRRFLFEASRVPHAYRDTPKFKELEMLLIPEESTRLAMVRTGAADLIEIGAFDAALGYQKTGALQLFIIPGATIGAVLIYGADDPRSKDLPTGKREVREGMALSINTKELVETLFGGLAQVAVRSVVTPGTIGWDPSWRPFEYNPSRAKDLIARAGYPNGFSVRVYSVAVAGQAWTRPMIEAVAGYWNTIGLQPQIVATDTSVVAPLYRARPQATEIIGQVAPTVGVARPNNLPALRTFFHSNGVTLQMSRPEMDALIDRAFQEVDPQKQADLVRQIMERAHAEFVSIPISRMPNVIGASKSIAGWKPLLAPGMGLMLETVVPKR